MSMPSVRRTKERGGGGGKFSSTSMVAKPSRNLTPVSEKSIGGGEILKRSAGKENPRPTSRVRAATAGSLQKPAIRPMPRIDKPTACAGDSAESSRVRWSTSSVPRGRSSSPSEFNRALSDLRKNRVSRVSVDRDEKSSGGEVDRSALSAGKFLNGSRVVERIQQKKGAYRDLNVRANEGRENDVRDLKGYKDSASVVLALEKTNEVYKKLVPKSEETENRRSRALDDCSGEDNIISISVPAKSDLERFISESKLGYNVNVLDVIQDFEESKVRSCSVLRSKDAAEKSGNGFNSSLKESSGRSLNRSSGLDIFKEKGVSEEGVGGRTTNRCPSKIHEKLAFLEGKVKRIASDIKRTKEMLDMNNPDSSKVILSDIQEKICGIEKAMGHVVDGGADGKMGLAEINESDNMQTNKSLQIQKKQADATKSLVKGLNTEELEARFFPHHKLLRDRISFKTISGSSHNDEPKFEEPTSESKIEEKLLSSIDENPIALEFLASLNKEQSKVITRGGDAGMDFCEVQEMDSAVSSDAQECSTMLNGKGCLELMLTTNETLDEFDDQENRPTMVSEEETEDSYVYQLNGIGYKTSTAGWFVSEGESVLLALDDGSCSFYDIANSEGKAEYKPPVGISPNLWRDCWIVRAPGADGCSGRYVVAASAGNTMDSGFCSWDFYTKDVRAFHIEDGTTNTRTALAPLPNNTVYRRSVLCTNLAPENQQWWYKPCGPLIVSTATNQRVAQIYDIRDGEKIMEWEVQKPVLAMDYSSPLQWRNRGKVVVAQAETISLWDVSSLNPQPLISVSSSGRKISALHVNNTDAELGGGVRQRASSSEAEGNDGVFCTPDSIIVLDFRNPSGVGRKIPKLGVNVHSVFSKGDSIFLGCTNLKSAGKKLSCSQVQQFSLRKQSLVNTYELPESNAHLHYTAITQVWGNSNIVMGVCGLGLFVFDALNDDGLQSFTTDYGNPQNAREIIGPDDLYSPSFDFLGSRVLLISRDRPALWRYLS